LLPNLASALELTHPSTIDWESSKKEHLEEELSDVLLYLIRLADRCGVGAQLSTQLFSVSSVANCVCSDIFLCFVDLPSAAMKKIDKNGIKYPASKVKGSSAKYDAYTKPRIMYISKSL
jgi:dCTP diphosphatase